MDIIRVQIVVKVSDRKREKMGEFSDIASG